MSLRPTLNRADLRIQKVRHNFYSVQERLLGFWWVPILTDIGTLHSDTSEGAQALLDDEAARR